MARKSTRPVANPTVEDDDADIERARRVLPRLLIAIEDLVLGGDVPGGGGHTLKGRVQQAYESIEVFQVTDWPTEARPIFEKLTKGMEPDPRGPIIHGENESWRRRAPQKSRALAKLILELLEEVGSLLS